MSAVNVVRFRVKPGREEEFLQAHRDVRREMPGFYKGVMVSTGDRTYCFVGYWQDMASIAAARPQMIAILDTFRDTLEDLGGGLGVTDPVSGEVVLEVSPAG